MMTLLMKRKALFAGLVLLLAVSSVWLGCRRAEDAGLVARIGFLLPLGTDTGQQARLGGEIALQVLNGRHEIGVRFEPRWEDARSDPAATGTRMEALASDASILGCVGPIDSGPATSAADVANRDGVVLISPLASTPALAKPDDYFFRTWPSDAAEARFVAEFARRELKLQRLFILNVGAAYGQALARDFSKAFDELGGTVIDSVEYPADTQTFGAYVNRVRTTKPDALYYVGYPPDMAEVLRELRSRKVTFPVLSAAIVADPTVAKLAGANVEGVLFPFPDTFNASNGTAAMKQFQERFRTTLGQDPSFVAAQAYDAVMVLAQAIVSARGSSRSLPDRRATRSSLQNIKQFEGATGTIRFDANGDAVRSFRMYHIQAGSMVPYAK